MAKKLSTEWLLHGFQPTQYLILTENNLKPENDTKKFTP